MNKIPAIVLVAFFLFLTACAPKTESNATYFPLSPGAYWIYEGHVKWDAGRGEIREKDLTWKMEVIEVVKREDLVGYKIHGHPYDLAWYEDGKEQQDHAIIQVGPSRFYKAPINAIQRLKDMPDGSNPPYDLVTDNGLVLDVPLLPRKRFCEAEQITRLDGRYCWFVGEEEQIMLTGVKGISGLGLLPGYTMWYATLPDYMLIQFVPSVGITRFQYAHHGTVSECDVHLIEYHPGTGK